VPDDTLQILGMDTQFLSNRFQVPNQPESTPFASVGEP